MKSLYHLEKNYHYSQMCAVRAVKLIFNTKKRYQNSEMNHISRNNPTCKLDFRFEFNRYLIGLKLNYDYEFNV